MSDMHPSARDLLRQALHKHLLLDLEDRLRAEAIKAFEMVRDRAGLGQKRARELEGQARFRMMEQGFEEICKLHGGNLLVDGIVPSTTFKIFQPFMRFDFADRGVILGMAAMADRETVPIKNKSRLAGVALNYTLSPKFDFDGAGAKIGDVFCLLLVCRDREKAGMVDEIAVGVIDSAYSTFLFYEPIEMFISVHQPAEEPAVVQAVVGGQPQAGVKLKDGVRPFSPPEVQLRNSLKKAP